MGGRSTACVGAVSAATLVEGPELAGAKTLLGHRSLRTTQRDTHVAATYVPEPQSPLDRLPELARLSAIPT